jgi:hypothetical protein
MAQMAMDKDTAIAKYLKSQGVTPEQWTGMSLEDRNATIKKVKPSYKPMAEEVKGLGRDAKTTTQHIANRLREMQ